MGTVVNFAVFFVGGADAVNQLSGDIGSGGVVGAAGTTLGVASAGGEFVGSIVRATPLAASVVSSVGVVGTTLSAVQLSIDLQAGSSIKAGDVLSVAAGLPIGVAVTLGVIGTGSILIPLGALAVISAGLLNLGGYTLDDVFKIFPESGSQSNGGLNIVKQAVASALPLSSSFGYEDNPAYTHCLPDIQSKFNQAKTTISPLVLDLNGDGVSTLGQDAGVHFDHDGNGFAELTGWANANDGLLVLDRNGNGTIDDGGELFGNKTALAQGGLAANGFAALADHDSDADADVDANDTMFSSLRVWKDANSNGVTDSGELLALAEAGVKSLQVGYSTSSTVDANGNAHKQVGSYVRTDDTTASMNDVWFGFDAARHASNNNDQWREVA